MFILNLIASCNDPGIVNIISIIKKAFNLIQIFAPILAIVSLSISFVKIATNPDGKKNNLSLVKNCLIALVIVFLIPVMVNATMGLLGDSYSISSCWNMSSSSSSSQESSYNNTLEKEKKSIMIDPSTYDVPTQSSNSNNNSTSTESSTASSNSSSSLSTNSSNNTSSSISSTNNSSISSNHSSGNGITTSTTHSNSVNGVTYNLYSQSDSRWGSVTYPSGNSIAKVGCMITSIAVVSSAYDSSITPYTVFNSSHRNNYPWAAVKSFSKGSFDCYSGSTSKESILNFLSQGNVVVVKVYGPGQGGSNQFTKSQHYMALIDYNGSSVFVGNGYATSGNGAMTWHDADKVLTSVNTADYCAVTSALWN